jgi:hypothetical protein
VARQYLGGDQSLADDYTNWCMPLYATKPIEADRFSRLVVNPDLSGHFKREWNAMDLRPGLGQVACPVLAVVPVAAARL